jgi:acetate kinase
MADGILVINAGSSSVKFALFLLEGVEPDLLLRGQVEGIGTSPHLQAEDAEGQAIGPAALTESMEAVHDHEAALALVLDWLAADYGHVSLVGAGHRVVHGGTRFSAPVLLDDESLGYLASLQALAPHHQPHNVAAIRAVAARRGDLPQVACFDTAFHAGQPEEEARLPLPHEYWQRGIRRYGFHGLSYEYIAAALPSRMADAGFDGVLPERLVIAHLGNGASMCAVKAGRSIATTMGFSTLDGLPMGTRSGAIDPGVLLHLMDEDGLDSAALTDLLYNRAGLLGLSGIGSDMRALLASDSPDAALAVQIYCYRIARHLGSLAVALGGLDALVFTGGIGEHAAPVRAEVCRRSAWLGMEFDEAANDAGGPLLTTAASRVTVWTVPTNEELMIARHVRDTLAARS